MHHANIPSTAFHSQSNSAQCSKSNSTSNETIARVSSSWNKRQEELDKIIVVNQSSSLIMENAKNKSATDESVLNPFGALQHGLINQRHQQKSHIQGIVENVSYMTDGISKSKMENFDTVENVKKYRGKTLTLSSKKRKQTHTKSLLPPVLWIHHNPNRAKLSERYKASTLTPTVRIGLMPAFNIYWIQPTQLLQVADPEVSESYVQGGKDENSYYIKQLNSPNSNALAMVLCHGSTVYVAMLRGFRDIFSSFSKSQVDKITPTKEVAAKLTPEKIRGVCHRVAVESGFTQGVGQCRCLPLATWNEVMLKLYNKIPTQKKKAAKNPLNKITALVKAFDDEYTTQIECFGVLADSAMYEDELNALVNGVAEIYAEHGGVLFRQALAKLNYKKEEIKSKAGMAASALKRNGATTVIEVDTSVAVSVKTVQIEINHLKERVGDIARTIINCPVTSPTEHVCKNMLVSPSCYMQYIGLENTPTFQDLKDACGDKHGLKNDIMVMLLGNRAQDLWVACITLILSAHKQGLDCSKIMGESNATSNGNKISGYDADGHIGSIVHACTQGGYKKQQNTFSCHFSQVIAFGKPNIKKSWKNISKQLNDMVLANFPDDTESSSTFKTLQLNIGMATKIRTLTQKPKERTTYIQHLKWVFILYVENLPVGEKPTVENFISVMLSPMGVSFCDAYLSWVSTGYYRLRAKAHAKMKGENVSLPAHIKLMDVTSKASIHNTIFGQTADDIFDVLEALILAEWSNDQKILCSAQMNSKYFPMTHANSHLGRAAGAMSYWLIGAIRILQQFAPRPGILEQIYIYTKEQWLSIQPGANFQKELRLGLSFVTGSFGDIEYIHAHKTCGNGGEASPLFEQKAAVGNICKSGQWSGTGTDGAWDFSGLTTTFSRFKEAADIVGSDPMNRKYIINIKDPLNSASNFKVMTSHVVSSPAMPVFDKYHHFMHQAETDLRSYKDLFHPLESCSGQGMEKHIPKLAAQGITPCHRPPKGCRRDHTLAKNTSHSKTSQLIQKLFKECIAPAIASQKPIEMNKLWGLKTIKKPYGDIGTRGVVTGKIKASSVYTFKANNVAVLSNLARFAHLNITQRKLDSVLLNCTEIAAGRLHVSANYFGRQTKISRLIAIRECLRQIPDWDVDEVSDRRLNKAIVNMSKLEGHELYKIIKLHYLDVHKTSLGSPSENFEHFDKRIRAHPIQPVFSLSGIESWPDTTVPSTAITRDVTMPPIQHAWNDVRNLTIAEQNLNMTTLTAYKESLQWIIDNQQMLQEKDKGIIRWFEERMNYDPMDLEVPQRKSPRGKKKRKRVTKTIVSM